MKKYLTPEMEVLHFDEAELLTASGNDKPTNAAANANYYTILGKEDNPGAGNGSSSNTTISIQSIMSNAN